MILIYNIINKKISSVHAIDCYSLLRNQEVLTFGFDDFTTDLATIMVQGKDLYLYIINFYQHEVI